MVDVGAVWVRARPYVTQAILICDQNINELLVLDYIDGSKNIHVVKDILTGGVVSVGIRVKGSRRFVSARPGHWLLRGKDGYFIAMSDELFREMYEVVK